MVLVVTNIVVISIEALSHLEDASRLSELSPEILGYFWDGVDSNTVEAILGDKILDPVFKILSYVGVTLIKIWESSKSAVFNLLLIVPVINIAVGVIVRGLV